MSINIAFIVGNGLDISLGLKTSYSDFYAYVNANKPDSTNQIYQAIRDDPDSWADFEERLGVYTRQIDTLPSDKRAAASVALHDAYDEVVEDICRYLDIEDSRLKSSDLEYRMDRHDFYDGLLGGYRSIITRALDRHPVELKFITLNYTRSIVRMFYGVRNILASRGVHIGNIHHAHGRLEEYIVMGVSDESQISSALEGDAREDLIKPSLLESVDGGVLEATYSIIDASRIVVIYGSSIGATDRYIWKRVATWLAGDDSRYLIIHKFDQAFKDAPSRNPARIKQLDTAVRNQFFEGVGDIGDDERVLLSRRIYIVRNTQKLFQVEQST